MKIPTKIVLENDNVTTISIPSKLICGHSFQAFVDKQFNVRGYQQVDYDIANMEIYATKNDGQNSVVENDLILNYNFSTLIRYSIELLRKRMAKSEINGCAIITENGKVLYSSLHDDILYRLAQEIESRFASSKKFIPYKTAIYTLEDNDLLFSSKIKLTEIDVNIITLHPPNRNIKRIYSLQQEILNEIIIMNLRGKNASYTSGKYWVIGSVTNEDITKESIIIRIDRAKFDLSRSVITNLDEIEEILNYHPFYGKIFITERYVELMRGLAYTLKDAAVFMNSLNKAE